MATSSTTSSSTTNASSSAGASVGEKIKGAFQTAHGVGESIRGNAMDFVDSALGTQRGNHDATLRGQQEAEVGVQNMRGGAGGAAAGTAPPVSTTTTTSTNTSTAAQPATSRMGDDVKDPVPGPGVNQAYSANPSAQY